jgi:hypothetical protein
MTRVLRINEKNIGDITKNLFSSLRKLDTLGADIGFVESFDKQGIGLSIMNMLVNYPKLPHGASCFSAP